MKDNTGGITQCKWLIQKEVNQTREGYHSVISLRITKIKQEVAKLKPSIMSFLVKDYYSHSYAWKYIACVFHIEKT